VLVVDETGDVKKGTATAGVQRQYTGTAGRIENSQVAVWLTYAGRGGHALIDRRLYLPRSWADDPGRRDAAGIPQDVAFATKPALAGQMISAALDAGVAAAWVTGDEVYGAHPGVTPGPGKTRHRLRARGRQGPPRRHQGGHLPRRQAHRAAAPQVMAAAVRRGRRQGPPLLRLGLGRDRSRPARPPLAAGPPQPRHPRAGLVPVLVPRHVPLAAYVTVAGRRWTTEENFQAAKGLAGLDEHQVRTWTAWHRWVTLAMTALAFLTLAAAAEHRQPPPEGLIPLTRNEIAHLTTALAGSPGHPAHHQAWSTWRRRHQRKAMTSHYARQAASDP
jgi:hypothetical protein